MRVGIRVQRLQGVKGRGVKYGVGGRMGRKLGEARVSKMT